MSILFQAFLPMLLALILLSIVYMDWSHVKVTDNAREGNLDGVKFWVNKGADVNYRGNLLSVGVESGNMNLIRYLVECGAKINGNDGQALSIAVEMNRLDIVSYLVTSGAYIDANHGAAVSIAIVHGYITILHYLLETGDVNANHGAALYQAVRTNRLDIVQYLVEKGANVCINNDIALKISQYEYPDIAIYLIRHGSKIELDYFSHPAIYQYLKDNGLYDEHVYGDIVYKREMYKK